MCVKCKNVIRSEAVCIICIKLNFLSVIIKAVLKLNDLWSYAAI